MCKRHMQTHLVGCTLSCQKCGKEFRTSRALQWHRSKKQCGRKNHGEVKLEDVEEGAGLGERGEASRYVEKGERRIKEKQENLKEEYSGGEEKKADIMRVEEEEGEFCVKEEV